MTSGLLSRGAALLFLGACTASQTGVQPRTGPIPQAAVDLAAPGQDLSTARLVPEDGCFWYLHAGPVETTLIPLRTSAGRPICTASGPATAR